eukprot:EG_transcript_16809
MNVIYKCFCGVFLFPCVVFLSEVWKASFGPGVFLSRVSDPGGMLKMKLRQPGKVGLTRTIFGTKQQNSLKQGQKKRIFLVSFGVSTQVWLKSSNPTGLGFILLVSGVAGQVARRLGPLPSEGVQPHLFPASPRPPERGGFQKAW